MRPESDDAHSITQWLDGARAGDEHARQQLWIRYYERLVRLAANRLRSRDRRVSDEEDIVVCAFDAFFRALDSGRFSELGDRDGLWRLLVVITDNKSNDAIRRQKRQKRGGGAIRGHSAFVGSESEGDCFDQIPDPSPGFADDFGICCSELLMSLKPELRQVAIWKVEGFTNREIADRLGCLEETVRRKVLLIRTLWTRDDGSLQGI